MCHQSVQSHVLFFLSVHMIFVYSNGQPYHLWYVLLNLWKRRYSYFTYNRMKGKLAGLSCFELIAAQALCVVLVYSVNVQKHVWRPLYFYYVFLFLLFFFLSYNQMTWKWNENTSTNYNVDGQCMIIAGYILYWRRVNITFLSFSPCSSCLASPLFGFQQPSRAFWTLGLINKQFPVCVQTVVWHTVRM